MISIIGWIINYSWNCQRCGATNPESYSYCNGCGAPKR